MVFVTLAETPHNLRLDGTGHCQEYWVTKQAVFAAFCDEMKSKTRTDEIHVSQRRDVSNHEHEEHVHVYTARCITIDGPPTIGAAHQNR